MPARAPVGEQTPVPTRGARDIFDWEYAHRSGIVTDEEYRAARGVDPPAKQRAAIGAPGDAGDYPSRGGDDDDDFDWDYAHRTGIVTDDEYRAARGVDPLSKQPEPPVARSGATPPEPADASRIDVGREAVPEFNVEPPGMTAAGRHVVTRDRLQNNPDPMRLNDPVRRHDLRTTWQTNEAADERYAAERASAAPGEEPAAAAPPDSPQGAQTVGKLVADAPRGHAGHFDVSGLLAWGGDVLDGAATVARHAGRDVRQIVDDIGLLVSAPGKLAEGGAELLRRIYDAPRDARLRLDPELHAAASRVVAMTDKEAEAMAERELTPEQRETLAVYGVAVRPEPEADWRQRVRGDIDAVTGRLRETGTARDVIDAAVAALQDEQPLDRATREMLQSVAPVRFGLYGAFEQRPETQHAGALADAVAAMPAQIAQHTARLVLDPSYTAEQLYEHPVLTTLDLLPLKAGAARGLASVGRSYARKAETLRAVNNSAAAVEAAEMTARELERVATVVEAPLASTVGRKVARYVGDMEMRDRLAMAAGHYDPEKLVHHPQAQALRLLQEGGYDVRADVLPDGMTWQQRKMAMVLKDGYRVREKLDQGGDLDGLFVLEGDRPWQTPDFSRALVKPGQVEEYMLGKRRLKSAADVLEPVEKRRDRQVEAVRAVLEPDVERLFYAATTPDVAESRRIVQEVGERVAPSRLAQLAGAGGTLGPATLAWGRKGMFSALVNDLIYRHDAKFYREREALLEKIQIAYKGTSRSEREALRPIVEGRLNVDDLDDTSLLFEWEKPLVARWRADGAFTPQAQARIARVRDAWRELEAWSARTSGLPDELVEVRRAQPGRVAMVSGRKARAVELAKQGVRFADPEVSRYVEMRVEDLRRVLTDDELLRAFNHGRLPDARALSRETVERVSVMARANRLDPDAVARIYDDYIDTIESQSVESLVKHAREMGWESQETSQRALEYIGLRDAETSRFLEAVAERAGEKPLYVPYQPETKPMWFAPQRDLKPVRDSWMMRSHAHLMRAGFGFVSDTEQVLRALASSRAKIANLNERLEDFMQLARRIPDETIAAAVDPKNPAVLRHPVAAPGAAVFAPQGYLRFVNQRHRAQEEFVRAAMRDGLAGYLDEFRGKAQRAVERSAERGDITLQRAADDVLRQMLDDPDGAAQEAQLRLYDHMQTALRDHFEPLVLGIERQPLYEIPREAAEAIADSVRPLNPFIRLVYDPATNLWRRVTLGMRVAWTVNNVFGNLFLSGLSGGLFQGDYAGVKNAIRAAPRGVQRALNVPVRAVNRVLDDLDVIDGRLPEISPAAHKYVDEAMPELGASSFLGEQQRAIAEDPGAARNRTASRLIAHLSDRLAQSPPGRAFVVGTDYMMWVNNELDNWVRRQHALGQATREIRPAVMRANSVKLGRLMDDMRGDVPEFDAILREMERRWKVPGAPEQLPLDGARVKSAPSETGRNRIRRDELDDFEVVELTPQTRERVGAVLESRARKSPDVLRALDAVSPEIAEKALSNTLDWLGDFGRMTHTERNVIRKIVPFYSWLRFISGLTLRLPVEHPVRTRALIAISEAGADAELDDKRVYAASERIDRPEYLRGAAYLRREGGEYVFTKATGRNPFGENPVLTDDAAGVLLASLNFLPLALMESLSGYDMARGRPLTAYQAKNLSGGRTIAAIDELGTPGDSESGGPDQSLVNAVLRKFWPYERARELSAGMKVVDAPPGTFVKPYDTDNVFNARPRLREGHDPQVRFDGWELLSQLFTGSTTLKTRLKASAARALEDKNKAREFFKREDVLLKRVTGERARPVHIFEPETESDDYEEDY